MKHESTSQSIGQRLREVRGGLTQAEFAEKMEVVSKTIRRYESDETIPDGIFLLRLKAIFNVDPTWVLLGGLTPPENHKYEVAIQEISSIIANLEKGTG
ncbi:helix-turn-helix domain-containing protein [Thiothrix unzii]|uniref:Helix-turn-helix transcriptional regulator n=1 Tax=Thiothrix unzii TaxID=111769 RepID=A0A975FBG8_9GAMM|nr:helix-turn-helix transcriptional regulator [Thiothrix unzii]QTR54767.1 helix-turn-helix transcriptional regulator [Thiothrix unzii]